MGLPKVACDTCIERPDGCWKAIDYGCNSCYWDAKKKAVTQYLCPLHLLTPFKVDRTVVINLKRREDLRLRGENEIKKWNSAWDKPTWFDAVDGWGNPDYPRSYTTGKGAWGCRQSHLAVLQQALTDKVESLFVLEGDFLLDEEFPKLSNDFFKNVPADWELVYLGGQHLRRPTKVNDQVVRVQSLCRTHAYIARPSAQYKLLDFWSSLTMGHIDNELARHLKEFKCYAPTRFIVGQGGAKSDILCRKIESRWWTPPKVTVPTPKTDQDWRDQRIALVRGESKKKPEQSKVLWTNRHTGTNPIIFHAPGKDWGEGGRNELWQGIADSALKLKIPPVENLFVITWNSRKPYILEQQLQANKQKHVVLGQGEKNWRNSLKNYLTAEYLKTVKEQFVMGLDAFDVCYTGSLQKAIDLLLKSGKKLVQNGDMGYWPQFTPRQYWSVEKNLANGSRWPFINSGVWVAYTEYAIWYYAECARIQGEELAVSLGRFPSSDQVPWHILLCQYPEDIGIDYECQVFQTDINRKVLK